MASKSEDRRRETIGCAGVLSIVVAVIGSIPVWIIEPSSLVWVLRVGFIILLVLGSLACFYSGNRNDEAFDYLRQISRGQHFDQDGFAFLPLLTSRKGVAYVEIFFQNQRDCRCEARVVMEALPIPFSGYRLNPIAFAIPCEAGVFGVARIPIPAPAKSQGKVNTWNVGASVKFPSGRGGLLRFGQGLSVGFVADQSWDNAIMIAGLLTLTPVLKTPARSKMAIPTDVMEQVPADLKPEIEVLEMPKLQ